LAYYPAVEIDAREEILAKNDFYTIKERSKNETPISKVVILLLDHAVLPDKINGNASWITLKEEINNISIFM
jgi:hypothetical protein